MPEDSIREWEKSLPSIYEYGILAHFRQENLEIL